MAEFSSIAARGEIAAPKRGLTSVLPEVVVFLLVAAALLIANWHLIDLAHIEVGDFAANSLLIEKAKTLHLLVGNYSRVGINHPGPAILYVLAFGELILFDWLHLLTSPLSGQMVAAILYNAFWIALIFGMLRRIGSSLAFAALVTAVFLFVVARQNYQFFAGMWFPELYFFPFATLLIAASRFANGKTDMLVPLALASGFLINGHVSFISTLGIIFLLTLGYNRITLQRMGGDRYILSREYWARHRPRLLRALILLILFVVPLLLETVRHFPGPLAQYISVGRGHHANTIKQAYDYSALFWGGARRFRVALILLVAAFGVGLRYRYRPFVAEMLGIVAVLLAASVAMLFYAKVGVDMLEERYIGFFYYSVPALAIAVLIGCIYQAINVNWKWLIAILLALGLTVSTYRRIDKDPSYAALYTQPGVTDAYLALMKEKPKGQRLVLNLDNGADWGYIWSSVLGIEMYAHRQGVDLLCVNRNWHISFTVAGRCTADEVAHNPTFMVTKAATRGMPTVLPQVTAYDLAFYRIPVDLAKLGHFDVADDPSLFTGLFLDDGWSGSEGQFVWMQHPEVHLSLEFSKGYSGDVVFDLAAFLPHPDSVQHASISVNGGPLVQVLFDGHLNRQNVVVPISNLDTAVADIKIVDHDLVSPKAAGLSDDPRTLGVSLYGFKVQGK